MPTIEQLCGWQPHPEHVQAVLSTLEHPTFAQAAPHLMQDWDGKSDVPLWQMVQKVNNNQNLPADKQTIGDCVSHGHARGLDYLQCIQIALGNTTYQYTEGIHSAMSEAIYGMCREEGNALGQEDGACGIWAVEALKKGGFVPRNGKSYDGSLAKRWGATGVPNEIKSQARNNLLQQYAQVRSTKECINSLFNGYPVTVCSNQGFTLQRNSDGICEAQGTWGHCMLIIGAYLVRGELIFVILQSWGKNVPSGPTVKDMPDNSFGARERVLARMLAANDSYSLSAVQGFPKQDINFYV
jgi:hypothetical protein